MDLFSYEYPIRAGFKGAETSREAAQSINAAGVRAKVLKALQRLGDATADEIAEHLHIDRLTIRPRTTELAHLGSIRDSGRRRPNASKRMAIVWEPMPN